VHEAPTRRAPMRRGAAVWCGLGPKISESAAPLPAFLGPSRCQLRSLVLESIVVLSMWNDGGVRRERGGFVQWFAVASLSACTWLADPFEAAPTPADAGLVGEPARDAAGAVLAPADAGSTPLQPCDAGLASSPENRPGGACEIELAAPTVPLSPATPRATDAGSPPRERDAGSPGALDAAVASACSGFEGFGTPELVSTGLASPGNPFGPSLSTNGLQLYFSVLLPGSEQIYTASRESRTVGTFSNASELLATNTAALEGSPFISFDDRRLYFFSDRPGGVGGRDIWFSERAGADLPFAPAQPLGGVNTLSFEHLPWLAADELSMLFVSSRPTGLNSDLWSATRPGTDMGFDAPVNVAELNSTETEGRAALSSDGLSVIFSSDRPGGLGDADLWISSRPTATSPFSVPRNLVQANSNADDLDVAVSSDEQEIFFASARGGQRALWRSTRVCP
jgi:WD40 repeat protein